MAKFLILLVAAYLYVSYVQHFSAAVLRQANQLQTLYTQTSLDQAEQLGQRLSAR